jgi:hypothetical protein
MVLEMDYHTLCQYLQFIQASRSDQPIDRWDLHAPAILKGLRRIRALARSIEAAEYGFVHRLTRELETELSIIRERLEECSALGD